MALLEYATRTVPDVVKKSVLSFYNRDPLLSRLQSRNQVKRSGGTNVRVVRVKSGHSDVTQIDASNISVPLNKKETLSSMSGDWAKYIKPIILPHIDRDRQSNKEDVKRFIQDMTNAAMQSLKNDVVRQLYIGNITTLSGLGTLNGNTTGLSSTGFENGALRFQTPADQASATIAYLGETRVNDTTDFVDNWFNQYAVHTGFGTDFMQTAEEIKITADTYAEDEEGISLGVVSISDHVALGEELRAYPGGANAAIVYTVDDLEKGRAHPTVHVANGVQYFANRWMTDAAIDSGGTFQNHAYFLNPNAIEYWVNANNDFRVTKFSDHLETSNTDADIAYILLEIQFAVPNLMANGCTSDTV
jgi:hypothetical protein|tara:strand:- start:13743 stop:14822 length:1080 start_codon:yes stop_codon:yes gene_type:complete